MLKLLWIFISLFIIILILIDSPSSSSVNSFIPVSQLLNFRSNSTLIKKLITINVFIFIVLTTILSSYFKI